MLRFPLGGLLGLSLVLLAAPRASSQNPPVRRASTLEAATPGLVCKIHALAELADDPNLCKWIAETIPAVVQPGTWSMGTEVAIPGQRVVRYYAPSKILVVSHSAAVQAEVDMFLASVKKSLPGAKTSSQTAEPSLMQASHATPPMPMAPVAAPPLLGYPVPTAAKGPKHLFHFIIRYEGDGVIDENIVNFFKARQGSEDMANALSKSGLVVPVTAPPEGPTTVLPPGLKVVPETIEVQPRPNPSVYLPQGVTVSPMPMIVPVAPRGVPVTAPPMPPVEAKSGDSPR